MIHNTSHYEEELRRSGDLKFEVWLHAREEEK